MCRSIKKLRKPEGLATETEIHEAARQFIRKISGFREPSRENHDAFEQAIDNVSDAAKVLLGTMAEKKNRKVDLSKV